MLWIPAIHPDVFWHLIRPRVPRSTLMGSCFTSSFVPSKTKTRWHDWSRTFSLFLHGLDTQVGNSLFPQYYIAEKEGGLTYCVNTPLRWPLHTKIYFCDGRREQSAAACTACILTPFESHTLVWGTLASLFLSLGSPYDLDPEILCGSNAFSPKFSLYGSCSNFAYLRR